MACAESGVLEIFSALTPLPQMDDDTLQALSHVPPDVAAPFVRCTYRDLKNNPLAWSKLAEIYARSLRSEFSLSDWLRQVVRVYAWLGERGCHARLSDVVEYISCGFEGGAGQPGDVIDSFLSTYGFLRAYPIAGRDEAAALSKSGV